MPSQSAFVEHRLANGLRIAIEPMAHVPSAACGFLARTGARDDPAGQAGVSHFLEHMCFKGTARRDWRQVNIDFDEMGAHYNAFTSKDRTFYYGWVRTGELGRQMDLLADLMRPALPDAEFDTEKNVVLEEIAMSGDDLSSCAYDRLYEHLCAGSSMAWPVLGYDHSIQALTRNQMADYHADRYSPGNLALIVAGNVDAAAVIAEADRLCGAWPARPVATRSRPALRTGVAKQVIDRFHQQAVLLAFPAPSAVDPLNETAESIAAILGGVNSRFYWHIMQRGLCTRASAFYEEYADFGVWICYALCEPERIEPVLEAMRRELAEFARTGPEPKELDRVKNLRRTSLARESEAPYYRLGQIADDLDYLGRPRTAAERLEAVRAVSAETVADCLARYPITGEHLLVSVGPRDWPG